MTFAFFEVVRVEPRADSPAEIRRFRGRIGAVLGISAEEGQEPTSYAIAIDGEDEVWSIDPRELVSTGELRRREDYYDGTSIRVPSRGERLD